MAATYQQTAVQFGDRWDLISFRVFGNEYYAEEFLKVNQNYAYVSIFNRPGDIGLRLNIPVIANVRQVSPTGWADIQQIS